MNSQNIKKLRIAILGYGKMGHFIEKIARHRNHTITCCIDKDNQNLFNSKEFLSSDVAIEFSTPASALSNLKKCIDAKIPVVCGTTGWLQHADEIKKDIAATNGAMIYGSNFSIGVNVFMAVNRYLAEIMNCFPQYSPELTETHHIHKLDHPSGTAITLADQLTERIDRLTGWVEPCNESITAEKMPLNFIRRAEVPGIHTIAWDSDFDEITITHSAKTREGFALGAVLAAEWLPGHNGFFDISDMLAQTTGLPQIFKTSSKK